MASPLAQAANNRHIQLVATAVVSGLVVASVILGYQNHVHEARLHHLKESIGGEDVKEDDNKVEEETGEEKVQEPDLGADLDPEEKRALLLAQRAQAGDYAQDVILEQLTRNRSFLGDEGLQKVRNATVVVVGCGGVGSHAAAALARSGVSRIRLVDFDQVSLSSLNRHSVATLADVGRPKVQVLARRLQAVAPWVEFDLRGEKFDEAAADRLLGPWTKGPEATNGTEPNGNGHVDESKDEQGGESKDESNGDGAESEPKELASQDSLPALSFVVDAIDNIDTKVSLLQYCHTHNLPVISSMGAGTKSDPTKVVVGDISTSAEDGLSRATRRRLKLVGITSGIPTVFSTEVPGGEGKAVLQPLAEEQFAKGKEAVRELGALPDFRVRVLPVLGTMPAVFGYTLANHILLTLSGYPYEYSAIKGRDKMYDQILGAVHGFEEKLIRFREKREKVIAAVKAAREAQAKKAAEAENGGAEKEAKTEDETRKEPKADPISAAVGIRLPLTPGDVAFLVEDVFHGRSAVSGLPTRITLVRWKLPDNDDGTPLGTVLVIPTKKDGKKDVQKSVRISMSDLVCMTREEAARHQEVVLLNGKPATDLYDAATIARIEGKRGEAAEYEKYR